jgi:hypothetical protein
VKDKSTTEVPPLLFPTAILAIGLLTNCEKANTMTGPHSTISPTPAPAANLTGSWTGTYTTNDGMDCDPTVPLAASATFQQNGSTVTGSLLATGPCGLGYDFDGKLEGTLLRGSLSRGAFTGSASGTLAASGTSLVMTPSNSYGYEMGTLQLHRE